MNNRPYVLSIAGFDPSGGAGVLADIKTFEQFKVYGLGACTSITYQTDDNFIGLEWLLYENIINQIEPLFSKYNIQFVKIGIIENLKNLKKLVDYLINVNNKLTIVWDPVLKASAGYNFHSDIDKAILNSILNNISYITPNYDEFVFLFDYKNNIENFINHYNTNIIITGNVETDSVYDILISKGNKYLFNGKKYSMYQKHGTGCVYSSALISNLAKGNDIQLSCSIAKNYVENILLSNKTNLAYHNID